jgi:hypothetical protein
MAVTHYQLARTPTLTQPNRRQGATHLARQHASLARVAEPQLAKGIVAPAFCNPSFVDRTGLFSACKNLR